MDFKKWYCLTFFKKIDLDSARQNYFDLTLLTTMGILLSMISRTFRTSGSMLQRFPQFLT